MIDFSERKVLIKLRIYIGTTILNSGLVWPKHKKKSKLWHQYMLSFIRTPLLREFYHNTASRKVDDPLDASLLCTIFTI